jgi:hypothetical protein
MNLAPAAGVKRTGVTGVKMKSACTTMFCGPKRDAQKSVIDLGVQSKGTERQCFLMDAYCAVLNLFQQYGLQGVRKLMWTVHTRLSWLA